jgi:hypothetical protein
MAEFARLLRQETILENMILTGLRGVGKTVLLDKLKPLAIEEGWLWVGTDLSESTSVSEANLALRLLTDLSPVTSTMVLSKTIVPDTGLARQDHEVERKLDFATLNDLWVTTPGLASDKLRKVLEIVWELVKPLDRRGIVFAYDEAQNLADHAEKDEYPLSLLLDVFQSIQRTNVPFMLVLTGLPTLFPNLVEARTFAERMFRVVHLNPLNRESTAQAIRVPIEVENCPISFSDKSVDAIFEMTAGYPYFIQFVCREAFDVWSQQAERGEEFQTVPMGAILRKLDTDFFAGRWARATDRQRDLLAVISQLESATTEFTVQEIVDQSASDKRPFKNSHVNQMLGALSESGLVYKYRWGKYSLAVPLLDRFIRRQMEDETA